MMPTKETIETLRKAMQARFEGGKTPEDIKAATEELASLDSLEKEIGELQTQNATLLASYKDIVKHEPIANKEPPQDDEDDEGEGLEFAEALEKVLSARKGN